MIPIVKKIRTKIETSELANKIFKALIGSAGIRILGMALGFLVGVQLARGLEAEGYGMYSLVMSMIAIMTVPTEFGVPQLTIREVAKANAKQQWNRFKGIFIWSNSLIMGVFLLFSMSFLIANWFQIKLFNDSEYYYTFMYGIVLVPLVALTRVRGSGTMGLQHIISGQLPNVVLRPLFFSISLYVVFELLKYQEKPSTVMLIQTCSMLIVLSIAVVILRRATPIGLSEIKGEIQNKKWFAASLPMALTEGMRVIQGHISLLILGFYISLNDVGIFKVAISISVLIAMPISLINIVSGSIVSDLYSRGQNKSLAKMAKLMAVLMVVGVLIMVMPFVFFGNELIVWAFGKGYEESATVLLIISVGHLVNAFFGINATLLNMTRHEKRVTKAFVYSLVFNIVFAIILIPQFEIIGAALTNTLALIVWNLIMWYDTKKLLNINSSAWTIFSKNA